MFAAAYATDSSVRSGIIDQIWTRLSNNATDTGIFSTAYKLDTGAAVNNFARSVVSSNLYTQRLYQDVFIYQSIHWRHIFTLIA